MWSPQFGFSLSLVPCQIASALGLARWLLEVTDPHPGGLATSRAVVLCFVFQDFQQNLGVEYFGGDLDHRLIVYPSFWPGERKHILARCGSHICPPEPVWEGLAGRGGPSLCET